ncbi:MAG: hypothetical protein HGA45_16895, partial [Chloroflexales bacterium]|nr:hypothetical protein [Chloroflexales bacterium]
MSVAPNSSDDIHLDAEGVRAALRTLDVLAGDLEAQTQRLRGVLDEAEAGDRRHGYLDGGLRMGYEAASLVGTARAELRDAVSNARATVRTLEEHDLGAAVVATTVILPTLASLPVAIAIPPIGADLGAAVERTDEAADAVGEVSADIGRLQEATTTISSLAEKTIEFQQVEDHHFARSMPRPFLSGTAYPPVTLPEQPQAQDPARSVIDWFKDRWSDAQRGAERQGARLLNVVAQLWRALQRLSAELQSFGRALWRAVQGIVDLFRDLLIEVWSNIWPLIEDYFGKFLGRILRLGQTLLSLAALILTFVPRAIAALLRGGLGELVRFLADTAKRFVRLPITLLVRTLELLGVMERLQGLLRLPAALGRQTAPLTT